MTFDRKWKLVELTSIDPSSDGIGIKPKFLDSLGNGHFSTIIQNDKKVASSVIPLFLACSPIAIVFRVTFGVVMTLYGQFWRWTKAYVVEKRLEGKAPFVRHFNASGAVVSKGLISSVVTARNDQSPDVVFRHRVKVVSSLFIQFATQATAAFAVAGRQCRILNQSLVAAFAAAEPHLVLVAVGTASQDSPASVLCACNINDFFWWPAHIEQYAFDSYLNQGE